MQPNQPPRAARPSKSAGSTLTWLDQFEQFCRVIDKYLRWYVMATLITIFYCVFDQETAGRASITIIGMGSASSIKSLIEAFLKGKSES